MCKSLPQARSIFHMVFLTPDFCFLKENPDEEVTDFLDFFLTNENRERGVKKC